jgi:hypothetical protein
MGITGTRWIAAFKVPPVEKAGEVWRYGLGLPLQVADDRMAIILSIRRDFMPYVDFEAGADVVELSDPWGDRYTTLELSRNHLEPDPRNGEDREIVKYPTTGGFVPSGAMLEDGSPHPHAGTGFGIIHAIGFPLPHLDPTRRLRLDRDWFEFAELQQYGHENGRFVIRKNRRFKAGGLPAGVSHGWTSFTAAIPDGQDLLFSMRDMNGASGVSRWKRGDDGWLPVEFHRVPGAEGSIEPSLVRDVDGSFLFCARGDTEESIHSIRVWRSMDCISWDMIVNSEWTIARSPVTVNTAADGTPYVASNPMVEDRERFAWGERGILMIWQLNPRRDDLEDPIVVCNGSEEFGESPSGEGWYIDHPNGQTLLIGGRWRHVLVYRVADRGEVKDGTSPVEATGCHLAEVTSSGENLPAWGFGSPF